MHPVVIINPVSGTGGRPDAIARRVDLARRTLRAHGAEPRVVVTEAPGHAYELAKEATQQAAPVVFAWGGDGTINEIGSALAFGSTPLAIIPAGSGNGLARELGIPFKPEKALAGGMVARDRTIDVGELVSRPSESWHKSRSAAPGWQGATSENIGNMRARSNAASRDAPPGNNATSHWDGTLGGRMFLNVAGIGFDALVAERFNNRLRGRRGALPYFLATFRELRAYVPLRYEIHADGDAIQISALLLAVANGRQYGNGAIIAPDALLDDGRLDLVMVESGPWWSTLWNARRLFVGRIDRAPRVATRRITNVVVRADRELLVHVDGEPFRTPSPLVVRVHPGALRVRG